MKYLILFFPVFLGLHACSQSPGSDAASRGANSILTDTSGVVLGESPDRAYRLFKFTHKSGEQTIMDLKLLRLKDLQEILVSTLTEESPKVVADSTKTATKMPSGNLKFYWSKDSKYLITENSVPDSTYGREVVLFDNEKFEMAQRKQARLLNFDEMNDVVFVYRNTPERQIIVFFETSYPEQEHTREIVTNTGDKLPVVILSPVEKKAKVKAYMADGVPINISFLY